jgi:hypothetical protein
MRLTIGAQAALAAENARKEAAEQHNNGPCTSCHLQLLAHFWKYLQGY